MGGPHPEDTFTLKSPSLGAQLQGHLDQPSEVVSFRGIPFADLSKRWTHSTVKHSLDGPVFDATTYGHRAPQPHGLVLVSGGLNDPTPGDDEFKCLNLNVAVHRRQLGSDAAPLPVMVWIHGGAFVYGANSVARYRPERFLQEAEANGRPVILVQVNYRLGGLGFAGSSDLQTEGSSVGNYGFVDQRNALLWVQSHIADFGGDPNNVTAFGVSAGSASAHFHLVSSEGPLFDRAILMSGEAGTLGPLPYSIYQNHWDEVCRMYNLSDTSSPKQRLATLRSVPADEFVRTYSTRAMPPLGGTAGGSLLPETWTVDSKPAPSRCKAIIAGDTAVEAVILMGLINATPRERLLERAKQHFDAACDSFLKAFRFDHAEEYKTSMLRLFSSLMFQHPSTLAARDFPGKAYLYHFDSPSPFKGPTYGMAYHGQCALYLHLNESEAVPEEGNAIAKEMVRHWVKFAYGEEPWPAVDAGKEDTVFMRFGPGAEGVLTSFGQDTVRDHSHLEWLTANYDEAKLFVQKMLNPSL